MPAQRTEIESVALPSVVTMIIFTHCWNSTRKKCSLNFKERREDIVQARCCKITDFYCNLSQHNSATEKALDNINPQDNQEAVEYQR